MHMPAVRHDEAAQTLQSVRAARDAADRRLVANWFPLVVVGVLLVASSFLFDVWDGAAVALFWLAAAPVAMFAIKRYQRVQLRVSGAVRDDWRPYVLFSGSFIAACVVFGAVGGAVGEASLVNYGPLLALAAAYAFVARRDRSRAFAAWAVVVAAFAWVAWFVLDIGNPGRVIALAFGARLVIEGFSERNKGHA